MKQAFKEFASNVNIADRQENIVANCKANVMWFWQHEIPYRIGKGREIILQSRNMPFVQQMPRLFNRQNVESLNPDQFGVYGLFKQGRWIYVGKGDIRQRLLAHLNGDNSCITREAPTHWVDEVIPGDPSNREKQLIVELQPSCNQKIG